MNFKALSTIIAFLCVGIPLITFTPTATLGQTLKPLRRPSQQTESPTLPTNENRCPDLGASEWLNQERVVFVSGEITAELAEAVIAQLLHLDAQAPGKDIYLYINSEGGAIAAGLAIYDVMKALRSDIVTVTMGEASSMGSTLLAGGTKGKRFALPNARIMIHQPLSGRFGQASDIAIEAKEILYLKNKLNQMLAEMTGQPLKRIETDTDRDFYMSAQEAKAYGLVDQVVKRLPSLSNPEGK